MVEEAAYDFAAVELERQRHWLASQAFETPGPGGEDVFVYACTPFTTGKLHMGHVRSYTIADVWARRARANGKSVLWAMGFDAFGLPNEMAAAEHAIAPRLWVDNCRDRMKAQFDRLGLSVDWSRCFDTSKPEYYRWTQFVFLKFLERNLVYRAEGIENWCARCETVLAALQVDEQSRCWRCGAAVELRCVPQWYLRMSPYGPELAHLVPRLTGWDDSVVAFQNSLIGETQGAELSARGPDDFELVVFNPWPEAIAEAAFIAVSPNHPLVDRIASRGAITLDLDAQRRRSLSRAERSENAACAIDTGIFATVGAARLPIVVTSSVDMRYGGGAALGMPTQDPLDGVVASQFGFAPVGGAGPWPDHVPAQRYRLRDNSVSRQRSWGAPVPIVHCALCGAVPVPEADLPVRLPDDLMPTGEGNALARHPAFCHCRCPKCGGAARRDADTLDVHFDSIWMLVPFCVPPDAWDARMFTHPELDRWLPVQQVVCGADQAGWWINDRMFFKVMRDCGFFPNLPDAEPVRQLMMHEMVLSGGRKMSKSLGNAVDPDAMIEQYGADTLRLAVLKVNPRKSFDWTTEALEENHRFLSALWTFATGLPECGERPSAEDALRLSAPRRKVARWIGTARQKVGEAYERGHFHAVLRELKLLFQMIGRFELLAGRTGVARAAYADDLRAMTGELLVFLEPLAPHATSALQERLARTGQPLADAADPPIVQAAE